jgi:N-acyl-phosphatidylethanolamine-hydrolysing phospholipase D
MASRLPNSLSILGAFLTRTFGASHLETKAPPYVPEYASPDIVRIQKPNPQTIQLTWVGHSTFLIQVAGINILTDPIWSKRASPIGWLGPKRHARPGIRFHDLPPIDVVLVSHTHYDHLDRSTIIRLGNAPRYIVPKRVGTWFQNENITNVVELPWWSKTALQAVTIHAVPAKHWSKRWLFRNERDIGWSGYVVETPVGTVYFAGDTGYHPRYFKDIGKNFNNIDISLIPIGAYYPREVFGNYHIDPREALKVHKEVGAKQSVGMHWGVFKLTQESVAEPPLRLAEERDALNIQPQEFSVMKIGESRSF